MNLLQAWYTWMMLGSALEKLGKLGILYLIFCDRKITIQVWNKIILIFYQVLVYIVVPRFFCNYQKQKQISLTSNFLYSFLLGNIFMIFDQPSIFYNIERLYSQSSISKPNFGEILMKKISIGWKMLWLYY